jgi:hypothetical protein
VVKVTEITKRDKPHALLVFALQSPVFKLLKAHPKSSTVNGRVDSTAYCACADSNAMLVFECLLHLCEVQRRIIPKHLTKRCHTQHTQLAQFLLPATQWLPREGRAKLSQDQLHGTEAVCWHP